MNTGRTNHEMVKAYEAKLRLIGAKPEILYELGSSDRVALRGVLDKESTGRITIPSFITNIGSDNFYNTANIFYGCNYSEIYIMNRPNQECSAKSLFNGMESTKLKVVFKHPECIVNMYGMFNNCKNLIDLDISNLNTSNVTDMGWMFGDCRKLRKLDLKNFDTRRVESIGWMFKGCESLASLNISSFNTEKVRSMSKIFCGCESLVELDISNFRATSLEHWSNLFTDCKSLINLNLRGFSPRELSSGMPSLFHNCSALSNIYIGDSEVLREEIRRSRLDVKIIK